MSHLSIRLNSTIRLIPLTASRRLLSTRLPADDLLSRPDGTASTFTQQGKAGPFPIGSIYDNDREERIRSEARSWRQLKGSEKVGRAWSQLSSLVVVLVGGGLFIVVFYSTGSELFSANSPTRVFEDCVDRVKDSEEVNSILLGPLTFHGDNYATRLRRNRRVSSTLTKDPIDGQEVLRVKFWVEGTVPKDPSAEDATWWDTVKHYVGPLIWEDSTKPGSFVPRPSTSAAIEEEKKEPLPPPAKTWAGWVGEGLVSLVGGLIPTGGRNGTSKDGAGGATSFFKRPRKPFLGEFSSGEAFAELKKDPNTNTFEYKQLYVDVPDSRSPNAYRIYIDTAVRSPSTKLADRIRFWRSDQKMALS